MHIILAIITALGSLAWALYMFRQSGIDINSFNPFFWMRRHAWSKKVGAKPRHQLDKPMDAAAAILLGAVKTEGEISREQKQSLISLFEEKFHLSPNAARELFSASAFLMQDVLDMAAEVRPILSPSLGKFTSEQKQSVLDMLHFVCNLDGEVTELQRNIIDAAQREFAASSQEQHQWS